MANGTVKWFNEKKGYGFIKMENGSEIFVHHSEIQSDGFRTLSEGQNVEFQIKQNQRGDYAADVVAL